MFPAETWTDVKGGVFRFGMDSCARVSVWWDGCCKSSNEWIGSSRVRSLTAKWHACVISKAL